MIIIVRMQGWDSPPDSPITFCEVRKINTDNWQNNMSIFSADYLGHKAKIIGGVKTLNRLTQTSYKVHEDGTLTFLGRLDTELPPPRKVKVINNPSKPIANWLSVLEQPMNDPDEDVPNPEGEF